MFKRKYILGAPTSRPISRGNGTGGNSRGLDEPLLDNQFFLKQFLGRQTIFEGMKGRYKGAI